MINPDQREFDIEDNANYGYGMSGNDFIHGSNGADQLFGDSVDGDKNIVDEDDTVGGDDFLKGYEGDDILEGGAGADVIEGDEGMDMIWGGIGDDKLYGGDGMDTIWGDDEYGLLFGDDKIFGGDGVDTLREAMVMT